MEHWEHMMKRAVHSGSSKKAARAARKLSKKEGEHAGRKAAMMMKEGDASLTAHGPMKRKQAFAIAASKIRRG